MDNGHNEHRKQQIGRERREELCQGLDLLGQVRPQTDLDPDRDPNQGSDRDQHYDASERE
jgi:hypothetical protein